MQDKLAPLAWSKVGRWCLFVWRRREGAGMGQTDDRQETTKVAVSARQRADIVGLSWARTVVTYSRGGARASGSEHPQPPQASTIRLFNPVIETTDGTGSHMSSWQKPT